MSIICGTDFSEGAAKAGAVGALLARARGEPLWLVHALEGALNPLDTLVRKSIADTLKGRLDQELAALAGPGKLEGKAEILYGAPHAELPRFAAEAKGPWLVLASAGHGASSLLGVGSTSERIALRSPAPVLVVREAGPFEQVARGERPLRVVLAVDPDARASASAVAWVEELRAVWPCEVVVVQAYYAEEARNRYGSPNASVDVVRAWVERDLQAYVGPLAGQGPVRFAACQAYGRLADPLVELAEQERADLMVVGSKGPRAMSRLWSVAAGVLHLSRTSVACVPEGYGARRAPVPERLGRVLCPVDLSEGSAQAVAWAQALVGSRGELHVVHVAPSNTTPEQVVDLRARLRGLAPPGQGSLIARVEILVHPHPPQALAEYAERHGLDAICMARRRASVLGGVLLGSVAQAVLEQANRPVFLIPTHPA